MEFNIADLFESVADRFTADEALVCRERRLSYASLDERANRVGHYLSSRGIKPGDHVGIYMYNCCEFMETMLGCFKIRAVPINLNYRYVADELRYLFDNADLVGLIHHRAFSPVVARLRPDFPLMKLVLYVDDDSHGDPRACQSLAYEEALSSSSGDRGFGARSADDLYVIYTGGTTGMPKGVMWRHEDVFFAGLQGGNPGGEPISAPEQLADRAERGPRMTIMPCAPFIHGAAQWAALIGFFGGSKVVIQSGPRFDAKLVWDLVEREGVNIMTIVGDAMGRPMADALISEGKTWDSSSLMVIGSAGAVFSESVKEQFKTKLPGTVLVDSFGSSESGHAGSMTATRGSSESGHPRFAMTADVTVLDDDLRPVVPGSGSMGKLARKGHLPLGYYKDPEKTAATFVEVDGNRWVIPGDLATVEADGTITVFGRGSVCINSGGEKIFPEEVEEALKSHPAIFDAIVVGVPDAKWGQRVAAVYQIRESTDAPSPAALQEHCRKHVAGYKVPRRYCRVVTVERQPSGKPDYSWAKQAAIGPSGIDL